MSAERKEKNQPVGGKKAWSRPHIKFMTVWSHVPVRLLYLLTLLSLVQTSLYLAAAPQWKRVFRDASQAESRYAAIVPATEDASQTKGDPSEVFLRSRYKGVLKINSL